MALGLLVVLLSLASIQSIVSVIETSRATQAAQTWVEGSDYTVVNVNSKNGVITIDILGSGPVPPVTDFDREGTRVLWSEPTVRVRVVNGSEEILTYGS